MRVIAGKAKSLKLKTIEGNSTRPTTDRIKETLFNIINSYLYDCIFVDVFAGSGGIGIEALSRGANKVYFIDNSLECKKCIDYNLKYTHLREGGEIICKNAQSALTDIEHKGVVADIIFMDPPYNGNYEKEILDLIKGFSLVGDDTLIIIEASRETDFGYISSLGYELIREKCYKTNKHIFFKRKKFSR